MRRPLLSPLPFGQPFFELGDEGRQRRAEGLTDGAQLHHVQAALADFHLADERLALPEALSQFRLRHPRSTPGFPKQGEQDGVLVSVDRFFHALACEQAARMVKSDLE